MKIKDINLQRYQIDSVSKGKTVEKEEKSKKKDSIHLSGEARELHNLEKAMKLQEIEKRLKSGFYTQRDIIEKVAARIARDLDTE